MAVAAIYAVQRTRSHGRHAANMRTAICCAGSGATRNVAAVRREPKGQTTTVSVLNERQAPDQVGVGVEPVHRRRTAWDGRPQW